MPERLKGHDWKSCVPNKIGTEGSNPSLSAMNHVSNLVMSSELVVQRINLKLEEVSPNSERITHNY